MSELPDSYLVSTGAINPVMKVDSFAKRIKRQFGDEAGVQVTNDDIIMWINDAQREAIIQNPKLNLVRKFVIARKGINIYDLPVAGYIAANMSISFRDNPSIPYRSLIAMTPSQFDDYFNDIHYGVGQSLDTAQPVAYTVDTRDRFKVWPAPSKDDALGFFVVFNAFLKDVDSIEDYCRLPTRYFQYVLEYCLMKSYEMDEDWAAADRKAQFLQSTLNTLSTSDGDISQQSYPVVGTTMEDYI